MLDRASARRLLCTLQRFQDYPTCQQEGPFHEHHQPLIPKLSQMLACRSFKCNSLSLSLQESSRGGLQGPEIPLYTYIERSIVDESKWENVLPAVLSSLEHCDRRLSKAQQRPKSHFVTRFRQQEHAVKPGTAPNPPRISCTLNPHWAHQSAKVQEG
jgi:hypothetical protein